MDRIPNQPCVNTFARSPERIVQGTLRSTGRLRVADFVSSFRVLFEYPLAPSIQIILDQSGYHRSQLVRDEALKRNMVLHYLPPYSPNLNPIERLWKVMNENVRNNVLFTSAKHFRDAISEFFETTILKIGLSLRGRINDNFQTIKPVPSS